VIKMTIEQLKIFCTVVELGSLKKASEQLYKTQPALSQSLKQLETSLAVTLFERKGYRLSLTDAGDKIYQRAQKLLVEATHIKELAAHIARGHETSITIAVEASCDLQNIIPIFEQTQSLFPQTQIIIKQEYLSGAREAVSNKLADIAISPIEATAKASSDFECLWLNQGALVNVAAPELIARHANLRFAEQLINEYQIVVQDSGISSQGKMFGVQKGQRCWYVNDFTAKKALILSGMGWGRLPAQLVANEIKNNQLSTLSLDDLDTELVLTYHAIRQKGVVAGPAATTFWRLIKEQYQTILQDS